MPSTQLPWGILNEITGSEAVNPASFFRRKLSSESVEVGVKPTAAEDKPKTSEGLKSTRSPRIAEALRRRRRRASTDQGPEVKAAAEAALAAAEQEELIEQQQHASMLAAAASAALCQDKLSSVVEALEKSLKRRLYTIEQKLDALVTGVEEQHEFLQQQFQQQHLLVTVDQTGSGDEPTIRGKRRPQSAKVILSDTLRENLRNPNSNAARQMFERQNSFPDPGTPKVLSRHSSSNHLTDSDDVSRFNRKIGGKRSHRLRRVDSLGELDAGSVVDSEPLAPVSMPPSPSVSGPAPSLADAATPEAPPGQPAWMETPAVEKPQKQVRLNFEVESVPQSRRGSVTSIDQQRTKAQARRDSWASSLSSSSAEKLRAKLRLLGTKRTPGQQAVWHFMEEAESSPGAMAFHWLMNIIVMVNVFFCTIQTTDPPTLKGALPILLHFVFDIFFTVEVITRFIVCPNRCTFFLHVANWVDMISAVPLIMNIVQCATEDCQRGEVMEVAMVILPTLRLCKLLRSFEKFHLLLNAFELAFEALPVLLYTLSMLVLFFAGLIYFAEPRANIRTLPQSIWLVITTMMTVGYGDVMPRTTSGLICTSFLIISSALYMAIPLGIVGGAFSRVWEDRDRLMLIRRTRNRLQQWGYTPKDILELFYLYDHDKSGELDLGEFSEMIEEMRLGIGEERVANLFKTFDSDGSGKVDDEEFVRALYPKGYASIYHFQAMTNEIMTFTGFRKKAGCIEGGQRDVAVPRCLADESTDEPGAGAAPTAAPTNPEAASSKEVDTPSTRTPTPGTVRPDFDSPGNEARTSKRLNSVGQASGLPGMNPLPGMSAHREYLSESSDQESEVPRYWSSGPTINVVRQTS